MFHQSRGFKAFHRAEMADCRPVRPESGQPGFLSPFYLPQRSYSLQHRMGGAFFLGMAERLKKVRKKHAISAEALGLLPSGSKRRRHRRSARYRIRGRPRSTSCTRFPCTRSFLRFWPKTGSGARCVNPSSEGSSKASTADPLPEGYCSFTTRTTRSGKNY